MAPTTDIEFRASDLITSAGSGSNGELLVNSLLDHYPPELQAAVLKRINPALDAKLDDKALESVAKIAGVPEVAQAHVRGGDTRSDEAVVTYAFLDGRGTVWKGCFPYKHLSSGKSDAHVSQRDSLAQSAIAKQFLKENPRGASASSEPADPFSILDATADELIALMEAHPERVEQIKALENTRSKPRKTVLEYEPPPPDEGDGGGSSESS